MYMYSIMSQHLIRLHETHTHTALPFQKGGLTAEVTEETDGWTRLRTVTRDWSSEEEESGKMEEDLREKIKVRERVGGWKLGYKPLVPNCVDLLVVVT